MMHEPLDNIPISGGARRSLDTLRRAYPRAIPMGDMVYELYGCSGPEHPEEVIRQHICLLRKLLPSFGWTIPDNRGGGRQGYRLEPVRSSLVEHSGDYGDYDYEYDEHER